MRDFTPSQQAVFNQFKVHGNVRKALAARAALVDETLVEVVKGQTLPLAIVAVGGYGRSELFPYSDIDLAFVYAPERKAEAEQVAARIVTALWDLGLTASQSLRTVGEAMEEARRDLTVRTNLLDARFICGDATLFAALQTSYQKLLEECIVSDYVEGKLAERDARHAKCSDSRFVLEPNLKEGKGGLRDLHTLYWLAKYIYRISCIEALGPMGVLTDEEVKAYLQAEKFLSTVRVWMHLLAGRGEERLTFDMQRQLAEALGYKDTEKGRGVERFMKKYYQTVTIVGSLTRSVCAVLEEDKKRKPSGMFSVILPHLKNLEGFRLDGRRLTLPQEDFFEKDPVRMIQLFAVAHRERLDIHPRTMQQVSRSLKLLTREVQKDPRANSFFMDILLSKRSPEATLRWMNESGVLGKFIPDFGRVIGQMQFDMYHVFTVDEHTINAIGILHGIGEKKFTEEIPIATQIYPLIKLRRTLYVALLCHDIAKGRGGDHSVLGETVARTLAKRFGLLPEECDTAAWLVRQHLLMSHTAFKRDLNDPKTICDFAEKIQSPERLRLLLVLTVADIRAVGPTVWNGWKGALLRELYHKTDAYLSGGEVPHADGQQAALRDALKAELSGWSDAEITEYLSLGGGSYWSSLDALTHARIARMVRQLPERSFPLAMDTRPDAFKAITEVLMVTHDQHGLFAKISGAMALTDLNIVGAKIFTLKNGLAVDLFQVQDIGQTALEKPERIARLAVALEQSLSGEMDLPKAIASRKTAWPSKMDAFQIPAQVFIENTISSSCTVIEVSGNDRIGFLYRVTKTLSELGLTIASAHITTYGVRAMDVFYVKDVFGMKILHDGKLLQIREKIVEAVSR